MALKTSQQGADAQQDQGDNQLICWSSGSCHRQSWEKREECFSKHFRATQGVILKKKRGGRARKGGPKGQKTGGGAGKGGLIKVQNTDHKEGIEAGGLAAGGRTP